MCLVNMKKSEPSNRKSVKFIIFNHSGVVGGGERSSLSLLKNLDKKKFDPLVIFPKGPYKDLLKETKVRYEPLDIYLLRFRTLPLYFLSFIRLFFKVRKEKPAFIYCNSIQASQWGLPLGFILRKPVIVHFRDWEIGVASRFILKAFPNYFAVANTNAVRNKMIKEGFMKQECSFVVYNAVDTEAFFVDQKDQKFRSEFNIPQSDYLVGIVGMIDKQKGHHLLIEALNILRNDIKNLKIVVVGDTSWTSDKNYFRELEKRIKELNLESRVIFTGFRRDVATMLRGLDLVAIPSEHETFGRLAIESMAVGKPVVGSNSGGLPEIIKDRPLGFIFKQGSFKELAAKIKKIYFEKDMLKSYMKNESDKVKKEFNPAVYSQSLSKIFTQVLGR